MTLKSAYHLSELTGQTIPVVMKMNTLFKINIIPAGRSVKS